MGEFEHNESGNAIVSTCEFWCRQIAIAVNKTGSSHVRPGRPQSDVVRAHRHCSRRIHYALVSHELDAESAKKLTPN